MIYKLLRAIWSASAKDVSNAAGFVERRGHHFFAGSISKKSLIVDLGSHKGEFAELVTSEYGCSVLGLEANPELYKALPQLPRTKFLNAAIHSDDAPVKFFISETIEASSVYQSQTPEIHGLVEVTVEGMTLNSLFKVYKLESVDLLKVDIESAEFEMLKIATDSTLTKIAQITVEFHLTDSRNEFSADRFKQICKRLARLGFQTFLMNQNCTDVLFLNTSRVPARLSQRIAHFIHALVITRIRMALLNRS